VKAVFFVTKKAGGATQSMTVKMLAYVVMKEAAGFMTAKNIVSGKINKRGRVSCRPVKNKL